MFRTALSLIIVYIFGLSKSTMFVLPDDLEGYKKGMPVFYYLHINNSNNNNSKLHFTTHCLTIGVNGSKNLQTTDGIETFTEGDLIFYSPGNYLSYQNIDNEQPYRSMMVFFNPSSFAEVLNHISPGIKSIEGIKSNRPYLSFPSVPYLDNYLQSLLQLNDHRQGFSVALQNVKLLELLFYLESISKETFAATFNTSCWEPSHRQLYSIMEKNMDTGLSLEDIAFLCNMSLATFKRSFKKNFGVSPGKWLKEKRLCRAASQIREFKRYPKEVFQEAGYTEYSSFSYAFKELFGVGPQEFRNTH